MPTVPQPLRARKSGWPAAPPRAVAVEYPDSDGKPMAESDLHREVMVDAIQPLKARYAHRDDVYVGGNLMMYYVEGNAKVHVSPDVFVALGPSREPPRDVWKTWEEGKFADFVLEVASKTTHGKDEVKKRLLYQRLGVAEYWQHDPTGRYIDPLKGHRLNGRGVYERLPLATTPEGMPFGESELLGLHLCLDAGRLRLFDPATGEFLLTHNDTRRQLAEERRIIAEERRRHAEERRALLAEIEALKREHPNP